MWEGSWVWGHLVNRSALKLSVFGCSVFGLSLCLFVFCRPRPRPPFYFCPHRLHIMLPRFLPQRKCKTVCDISLRYPVPCMSCDLCDAAFAFAKCQIYIPSFSSGICLLSLDLLHLQCCAVRKLCVYKDKQIQLSVQTRTPGCCIINVNARALG